MSFKGPAGRSMAIQSKAMPKLRALQVKAMPQDRPGRIMSAKPWRLRPRARAERQIHVESRRTFIHYGVMSTRAEIGQFHLTFAFFVFPAPGDQSQAPAAAATHDVQACGCDGGQMCVERLILIAPFLTARWLRC